MSKTDKKTKKGFTLIELLVVISIISLLSSVVLSSLNSARAKARDARRVTTVKQLQVALALYASDNNGRYPSTGGGFYDDYIGGSPTPYSNLMTTELVNKGYLPLVLHEYTYPNNNWPLAIWYASAPAGLNITSYCGNPGLVPYVIMFTNEKNNLNLPKYSTAETILRYCLFIK